MSGDLSLMRERLRRETAALLNLDIDNLTAAQSIRLDRAATLRLELDDIESRKLVGAAFDANKYIAISEALERLMGGEPDVIKHEPDFDGAFEEFAAMITSENANIRAHQARQSEKFAAELAEKDRIIAEKNSVIAALGGSLVPQAHKPPTSVPEPQTSPQPPLPPKDAPGPPAHYLRAPPELWRGDGDRRIMKPSDWDNRG